MARRKKKVIWYKKKGKFVSSSALKPHTHVRSQPAESVPEESPLNRKKIFAQKLMAKIKKAVEESRNAL